MPLIAAPDEVGLYFGVEESIYRSWNAKNQSLLGTLCAGKTLAHARYEMLNPSDTTTAQNFGQAFHTAILEPERFEQEWAVWAGPDKRSGKGKEAWRRFTIDNAGKGIIKQDEYDQLRSMRDSVWSDPLMESLLGGERYTEVCALWKDPATGLLCKGRIDLLKNWSGYTVLGDLKSTKDASPEAFARDVANYGWHRQAAFYLDGMDAIDEAFGYQKRERLFCLIAVEKEPPYLPAAYWLDSDALEEGRIQYRESLDRLAEAERTGLWPGYGSEVRTLELAPWALKKVRALSP